MDCVHAMANRTLQFAAAANSSVHLGASLTYTLPVAVIIAIGQIAGPASGSSPAVISTGLWVLLKMLGIYVGDVR